MVRMQGFAAMTAGDEERCEGRYPVPQTAPPREEPFDVTYRCALPKGHEGPHGSGNDSPQPIDSGSSDRSRPMDEGRAAARRAEIREVIEQEIQEHARFDKHCDALPYRLMVNVIEPLLAECDRRSRAVEALEALWEWASEQRTHLTTDPVPDGLGAQVLEALASPAPAAEDGRTP